MQVLDKLRSDLEDLDSYDMVDILQIYLLDSTGEEKHQREALDMATNRANLSFATVISVQDYIDLQRDFGEYEEQTRGR